MTSKKKASEVFLMQENRPRILLENLYIVPMTGADNNIEQGYITIEGQFITRVEAGTPSDRSGFKRIIDGRGKVALPGLINAHTHAAMTLLRSYADDLPLMEWLETRIWPLEAKLTGEDVYWGTMLGIAEMIKSGTTALADMYFFMDDTARAVEETGIRACLSRGMIGVGPESEQALTESRELITRWDGQADGRIQFWLGPHAPYTCPPDYLKKVLVMADELGVGIHIHLAETRSEFDDIMQQYGKTPTALLRDAGVFKYPVLAAHCVYLTDEDIAILADHRVRVVHNPQSNMKLASGIARVPEMLAADITVALGTDGASSNNNLDMVEELRACALLHKVNSMNPQVIPAYQALEMATVNGARALGLESEVGMLKPGMKADLILVDLEQLHYYPHHDIVAHLAYAGQSADVDTVIVDGRILMENRRLTTIDEQQVKAEVKKVAARLIE